MVIFLKLCQTETNIPCNISFESYIFPNKMKLAKKILPFKTGEISSYTNYRLVSPLPQFSKILENLFIEKYHLLSNSQYGFRNNM